MNARRRSPRRILPSARRALLLLTVISSVAGAGPPPTLDGPTGSVTGRIMRSDGPRHEVHVMVQETRIAATTRDGTFRFDRVPVGRHVFRIVSNYCEVQLVPVTVTADQVTTLDIQLACKPRPCPVPNRADRTCIMENPEQRARVGTRCQIHGRSKLKLDLVPVHHDIVGYTPGLGGDERFRFPNARPWFAGGCVDDGIPFAEVAYCAECRMAWEIRRR